MSVLPDQMTPPAAQDPLAVAEGQAATANAGLQSIINDFNPPQNNTPQFSAVAPQDHFQNIAGYAPLLAAFGAIGGAFTKQHGMTMLMSTNAMMKGMVQGSAEQYDDARKQYEQKYQTWVDQQRTWNDTYKAYMQAYKGRIDAQSLAVKGANSSVGLILADKKQQAAEEKLSQASVLNSQKLAEKIADDHHKWSHQDNQDVTSKIRAATGQARAETAEKEAATHMAKLQQDIKTADTNTLAKISRSLSEEAKMVRQQYPMKDGKRDKEAQIKLTSIQERMEAVDQRMDEHKQADHNKNQDMYDQARAAIAAGADKATVMKRVASAGGNPDSI